ncbi:MAG TPA: hypothetical protein VKS81_01575, partial [Bacteroidota bacterium]|nr:hypothetical protein [Bacteroidota bacterium]
RTIYFGNDGGVFQSTDAGESFNGRNGGLVTSEYYPGLAIVPTDSTTTLGGLQDNGALLYEGTTAWSKVQSGDGGFCAIDPTSPNVMFEEYVYLTISRSVDGGANFVSSTSGLPNGSSNANFAAPFVMSPSNPSILYAGAKSVYKTTNEGGSWFAAGGVTSLNGTNVSAIGVSWTNPDTLMAATGTGALGSPSTFAVFVSTNGGSSWTNVTGVLPNRYPTRIAFDPQNSSAACITYGGYGTDHVFHTTNLGNSWTSISGNLPDIPAQAIVYSPDDSREIYLGTDLGVFQTGDGGATWQGYNDGIPPTMIMDLVVSPANHSLRAATFGHGVIERPLPVHPKLSLAAPNGGAILVSGDLDSIKWIEKYVQTLSIAYSVDSGATWTSIADSIAASSGGYLWHVPDIVASNVSLRLIDMQNDTVISVSPSSFSIVAQTDLRSGWNLISVNVAVSDPSVAALFPNAVSPAYSYDARYVRRDSMLVGTGYWLKDGNSENFAFSGDSIKNDSIALNNGWNLIGTISSPTAVTSYIQTPPAIVISQYFGYSSQSGYQSADTLKPKKGYWVKSKQAGTLYISGARQMPGQVR